LARLWSAWQIDPKQTMHAGKVEIGAFRVYPAGYEPPEGEHSKYRIPLDRVEDFGAQAKRFYPLNISVYKSETESKMLELLWTKYWLKTLSSSPLIVVCLNHLLLALTSTDCLMWLINQIRLLC
jgi:COP9 signalosome complex subunit 5